MQKIFFIFLLIFSASYSQDFPTSYSYLNVPNLNKLKAAINFNSLLAQKFPPENQDFLQIYQLIDSQFSAITEKIELVISIPQNDNSQSFLTKITPTLAAARMYFFYVSFLFIPKENYYVLNKDVLQLPIDTEIYLKIGSDGNYYLGNNKNQILSPTQYFSQNRSTNIESNTIFTSSIDSLNPDFVNNYKDILPFDKSNVSEIQNYAVSYKLIEDKESIIVSEKIDNDTTELIFTYSQISEMFSQIDIK